ncbi:metallophosphatase [Kosmotoga arenicorallina S304]|uniref:Phosphoesterase n=1 Tax=Kosmotoga arenicorallina S304 TaxID=1453497 RepID=A0A176K3G9_9BACT|nr:YfcE family phosphodiesterase [Kosmotoga arenicorallina]OAA31566.1 metallophosphatase [Kosmotoga arenicorallina S304]
MRLAFISDIHGNLEALNAVLEDIKEKNIDKLYCIGDLVGYGPDPEEVVRTIMKQNITTIMGNYDDAIGNEKESCGCSYNPGRETEIGDITLNWSIKNTSDKSKIFLKALPKKLEFEVEKVKFLLVHGSPLNHLLEYVKPDTESERLEQIVSSTDADVIVNGHTHLPMAMWIKGKYIFNDGSVGRPKDGDPRASYLIIDVNKGTLKYEFVRVEYPIKITIEKLAKHELPMELATVLALGSSFDMGESRKENKQEFFL